MEVNNLSASLVQQQLQHIPSHISAVNKNGFEEMLKEHSIKDEETKPEKKEDNKIQEEIHASAYLNKAFIQSM